MDQDHLVPLNGQAQILRQGLQIADHIRRQCAMRPGENKNFKRLFAVIDDVLDLFCGNHLHIMIAADNLRRFLLNDAGAFIGKRTVPHKIAQAPDLMITHGPGRVKHGIQRG